MICVCVLGKVYYYMHTVAFMNVTTHRFITPKTWNGTRRLMQVIYTQTVTNQWQVEENLKKNLVLPGTWPLLVDLSTPCNIVCHSVGLPNMKGPQVHQVWPSLVMVQVSPHHLQGSLQEWQLHLLNWLLTNQVQPFLGSSILLFTQDWQDDAEIGLCQVTNSD